MPSRNNSILIAVAVAAIALLSVRANAAVLYDITGTVGDFSNTYDPGFTAGFNTLHYDPIANTFGYQFWDASNNAQGEIPPAFYAAPLSSFGSPPETYRIVLSFQNRPLAAAQADAGPDSLGVFYVDDGGNRIVQGGFGVGQIGNLGSLAFFGNPAAIYGNSLVLTVKQYLDYYDEGDKGIFVYPGPVAIQAQLRPSDFGEFFELQVSSVPEPATWAMLILGLFATGTALRSRQTSANNACSSKQLSGGQHPSRCH